MIALTHGLLYGLAIGAFVFLFALVRTGQTIRSIKVGFAGFYPLLLIVWFSEYFIMPAHTGYIYGYGYVVFAAAVGLFSAAFTLGVSEGTKKSSGASTLVGLSSAAILALVLGFAGTAWICALGTSNNARWAALGNITIAPQGEKPVLPDTDANEMVVNDVHLAYTAAHQALGSGGNNLGSYYDVFENEGVQQWIDGRNWFLFPLELNGLMEQKGWLTHQHDCGAGFVAVPADVPNPVVKIESGLCLKYLPGSYFSLNLQRYVYTHGYSDGQLGEPMMEGDDDWHVFFTISYVQPAFIVGGPKVVKVLIVDPANGEIKEYAPDKVPAWVDRVNSEEIVRGWTENFAKYGKVPDFFNSNGAGQMKVDTIRLINTRGPHQVYQLPLLANKDNAISTNGIVLYDTRTNKGVLYEAEGASGLGSSATLKAAFESIGANTQHWKVEHIQWYSIQSVPTWMAIYSKEVQGPGGDTYTVFAGIGFIEARDTNSADVQFGLSKEEALDKYKDWLSHRSNTEKVAEEVAPQTLSGTILRIAHEVLTNNQTSYTIVFKGDTRVFDVSHNLSPLLPVVRDGDSISITFEQPVKPTEDNRRRVTEFSDITLADQMRESANN
jgi:hypothetical protein